MSYRWRLKQSPSLNITLITRLESSPKIPVIVRLLEKDTDVLQKTDTMRREVMAGASTAMIAGVTEIAAVGMQERRINETKAVKRVELTEIAAVGMMDRVINETETVKRVQPTEIAGIGMVDGIADEAKVVQTTEEMESLDSG